MHDGYIGVQFLGVRQSSVLGNVIRDGYRGISMTASQGCLSGPPRPECFYATDNEIAGNQALGNFIDLIHHDDALGNTWQDNTCQTKEGAEIPECTGPPRRGVGRHLK